MLARLTDALRKESYPLAKVELAEAVVRHPEEAVDLLVKVDRGRKAGFGEVTITGTRNLDPDVVRSFIYIEPGDPYSPDKIAAMRKSMGQIEAIGSTRILESDHLDSNGNLPITVQVDERKQYAVSAAAQYSTIDGPSARAEWVDRNVFGGGERLRLDGTIGYSQQTTYDAVKDTNWFDPNRMMGRANANFIKPALWGSRNDYLADVTLAREVTTSYQAEYFNVSQYIRHRFDETLSVQGGWEIERGQIPGFLRQDQLFPVRLCRRHALRHDRQCARPASGRAGDGFRRRLYELLRLVAQFIPGQGAGLRLLFHRRGKPLYHRRPDRPRRERRRESFRYSGQPALFRRRRRIGARLCLAFAQPARVQWRAHGRPEPVRGLA